MRNLIIKIKFEASVAVFPGDAPRDCNGRLARQHGYTVGWSFAGLPLIGGSSDARCSQRDCETATRESRPLRKQSLNSRGVYSFLGLNMPAAILVTSRRGTRRSLWAPR